MATDNIKGILAKFGSEEEKDAYIAAQHETISRLNKRLVNAEEKTKHLEDLLAKTTPIISISSEKSRKDEEDICRSEISKLRDVSTERSLTLEEARKLELYHKVLSNIKSLPKTPGEDVKKISDLELISLVSEKND